MTNKYAVLVVCNYPNTENELHGCVNDVIHMRRKLISRFGFPEHHITLMIDTDSSYTQPTGKNILKALASMILKAKHGDVLFFHYSGHGTFIPVKKPHRRPGHTHQECIVPCDIKLITDDHFREIVNKVPKGASFTMMCDSCNSGGLIDKEEEQIGPHHHQKAPSTKKQHGPQVSRFVHAESLMRVLKDKVGNPELEIADIRDALFHLFGGDANSNVISHAKDLFEKNGSHVKNHDSLPLLTNKAKKDGSLLLNGKSVAVDDKKETVNGDMGILFSGCQFNETSTDANQGGGQAYGAFSKAVEKVLAAHKKAISNKQLVLRVRKLLEEEGYSQHPCLYCSDINAEVSFLGQE